MLLFAILLITLLVLALITVVTVGIGGAAFIVIFSDVIVCMAIIVFIMRKIINKRKED